jgi:Ca2+/H+ antiporter
MGSPMPQRTSFGLVGHTYHPCSAPLATTEGKSISILLVATVCLALVAELVRVFYWSGSLTIGYLVCDIRRYVANLEGCQVPTHLRGGWSILLFTTGVFFAIPKVVQNVEILVHGSRITEEAIGLVLVALLPSMAEIITCIQFALQDNIALSIEVSRLFTLLYSCAFVCVLDQSTP